VVTSIKGTQQSRRLPFPLKIERGPDSENLVLEVSNFERAQESWHLRRVYLKVERDPVPENIVLSKGPNSVSPLN
jgi:hypothetical protein